MNLNKVNNFKGTGLFVFSDPGGAKAVLAKVCELKDNLSKCFIISDRVYPFFKEFSLRVDLPPKNVTDYFNIINPDFVFTGTSYTSKIELEFLRVARERKVISYSFIDHWTNFKNRFLFNDQYMYPDKILVIDEEAKQLAIEDGINKNILIIYGNPYYKYLHSFQPKEPKENFFSRLGHDVGRKKIIVFAPDPLSNVNGSSVYGFDELSATKEMAELLDSISHNFLFFLKLHPNQNVKAIKSKASSKMIMLDASVDSNTLIYYSDLVIGFFSNFLIEANIMRKKVLRFHLYPALKDPLSGQNIGEVVNIKRLKVVIDSIILDR